VGTVSASSTYLPDTNLTLGWAIQNAAGVARTMKVDYVFAAVER
jgi:hypothetical protein